MAFYLAALGIPTAWISRVGDDAFGRMILDSVRESGVLTDTVVVDPTRPTGLYFKESHDDRTAPRYYRRGSAASAMGPEDLGSGLIQGAPLVHCTGITAALSRSCLDMMRQLVSQGETSRLLSFDANWRPGLWPSDDTGPDITAELARRADLVFVGLDEAAALWGLDDPFAIAEFLDFPDLLVIKDAANGATLLAGERKTWEPAPSVTVTEPVGAGDAFAAGFIAAVVSGLEGGAALQLGHAVAATALVTCRDVGRLEDVSALRHFLTTATQAETSSVAG